MHRPLTPESIWWERVHRAVADEGQWTIGHTPDRVRLAIGDAAPVELTSGEALELAAALRLRGRFVSAGT